MQYLRYIYTKKLLIVLLKFKLNRCFVFYLAILSACMKILKCERGQE